MQEEVENRTVNLAVTTAKLTERTLISAVNMYLRHREKVKAGKASEIPSGKQSVKELIGQNQGVSNIDIAKTDLRGFEGVARKYGIDYAVRKDKSVDPPKYLVFFKARDADAMTAAFNEYSAKVMNRSGKPSVLKELKSIAAKLAELPGKVVAREKQREQSR